MLAAQGLHWLDRQPQGPRWPSFGVAAAVTTALFAIAFVSMRSVAPWSEPEREPMPAPLVIPLQPPAVTPRRETPVVPQRPAPSIQRRPEPAPPVVTPAPQIVAPTVTPVAPPITIPLPIAPPVTADTSRARNVAPSVPTVPILRHNSGLSDTAMSVRGGASYAPAGVTNASRTKNSAKLRDSVITEKLEMVPWATVPMSAEAASGLAQSQDQARKLAQRSTSVGMTNGLYVPMGSGVGGVGAVNGGKTGVTMDSRGIGVSVPFPLFSSGPSPAQRKQNEKLLAEYLDYLRRQNDRILMKRDSIRADSAFRAANSKPIP